MIFLGIMYTLFDDKKNININVHHQHNTRSSRFNYITHKTNKSNRPRYITIQFMTAVCF
jgi:hypothetical protein